MVELSGAYSHVVHRLESLRDVRSAAHSKRRNSDIPILPNVAIRLSASQIQDLIEAYQSGALVKDLARDFKVHRHTVTSLLRAKGVELRQPGLSPEQVREAAQLYAAGWSLHRLAERYEAADMTVRRYLLLAGVEMRTPWKRGS